MAETSSPHNLLALPYELRLQIYGHIFTRQEQYSNDYYDTANESVPLPTIADFGKPTIYSCTPPRRSATSSLLLTCRQLYAETNHIYLANTAFYLPCSAAEPYVFSNLISSLPPPRRSSIRHLVLTGRISHLRALNETWTGLPFGNASLHLSTLTVVPGRPETHMSAYAEISDLSQSHTLAYVLAETLKSLRNVDRVIVRNEMCFSEVVWRLVYRSMVYRLWRWGGSLCGLAFRQIGEHSFEVVFLKGDQEMVEEKGWQDVEMEIKRLVGVTVVDVDHTNATPDTLGHY